MDEQTGGEGYLDRLEFPLIETDHAMDFSGLCETQAFRNLLGDAGKLSITQGLSNVKHTLSHQILYASFYQIEIELVPESLGNYLSLPCRDIEKYAVPRLIHIYLEKLNGNL